ncbi:hypothetical protein ABEF95_008652 [Exophiala dermatitidis]
MVQKLHGGVTKVQPVFSYPGTKSVTVVIGKGERQREFLVHQKLLCDNSNFFKRMLPVEDGPEYHEVGEQPHAAADEGFVHVGEQKYWLRDEDPLPFFLIQDWLYSGRVRALSTYTAYTTQCPEDVIWLKVYKMGVRLEMDPVQVLATEKFHEMFSSASLALPTKDFITALFLDSPESVVAQLEWYISAHVAFCILHTRGTCCLADYFDNERFARAVLQRMVNYMQNGLQHPAADPRHSARQMAFHHNPVDKVSSDDNSGAWINQLEDWGFTLHDSAPALPPRDEARRSVAAKVRFATGLQQELPGNACGICGQILNTMRATTVVGPAVKQNATEPLRNRGVCGYGSVKSTRDRFLDRLDGLDTYRAKRAQAETAHGNQAARAPQPNVAGNKKGPTYWNDSWTVEWDSFWD